jgi:pimeloyl-ACP methyl ester carboxylesterase
MDTHIVYVHGACASGKSFTRIKEKLPEHQAHIVEYTMDTDLELVVAKIDAMIKQIGKPVSIISHSLGGVLSVAASHMNPLITGVMTMGTPFGGCKAADMIRWFNRHIMFEGISTHGAVIRRNLATPLSCRVVSVVTSKSGNPMFMEPNDGVVTVASQTALKGPEYIHLYNTHNEVLMSDEVVAIAKSFIFKT